MEFVGGSASEPYLSETLRTQTPALVQTKYLFVTGGVTSSLGRLLEARGLREKNPTGTGLLMTAQKD